MRDFRKQFPFFDSSVSSIYFDNAATTQKPQCVIDAIWHANIQKSANVHRSSYQLAASVTDAYESARNDVAQLINAATAEQIFWSKGATESLNLLAHGLGELCRSEHPIWQGNEIIILTSEHHANILPWQQLVERLKPEKKLRITPLSPDYNGNYDYIKLRSAITDNTAIVAVAHVSNALGCVHPVADITKWAHQHQALCIVDGTQALAHIQVDVQALNCDAYVGSSHKMFGPTGVGFGYATHVLLDALPPYQVGGEMIEYVSFDEVRYQSYPLKFEAGTPNISGVIGMGAAARFVQQHQSMILQIEHHLHQHLLEQLAVLNTDLAVKSNLITIVGAIERVSRNQRCFIANGCSVREFLDFTERVTRRRIQLNVRGWAEIGFNLKALNAGLGNVAQILRRVGGKEDEEVAVLRQCRISGCIQSQLAVQQTGFHADLQRCRSFVLKDIRNANNAVAAGNATNTGLVEAA